MSYFFEDEQKKIIKPELFEKMAIEIAKKFLKKNDRNTIDKNSSVSRNQIRKIFDEFKKLERELKINKKSWEEIKPLIKLIKPKVEYNVARLIKNSNKSKSCYIEFKKFIIENIDKINNYEDFKIFILFFEAVYAYYYSFGGYETL